MKLSTLFVHLTFKTILKLNFARYKFYAHNYKFSQDFTTNVTKCMSFHFELLLLTDGCDAEHMMFSNIVSLYF